MVQTLTSSRSENPWNNWDECQMLISQEGEHEQTISSENEQGEKIDQYNGIF